MRIEDFDALPAVDATEHLLTCCAAPRWAARVLAARPLGDLPTMLRTAADAWKEADEDELLEAFAAHPVLGDVEHLRARFAERARAEQGQVLEADEATLVGLAEDNRRYFDRFGFIFILCARGVSAEDMLTALRARIDNDRATELANAAHEQAKIMDQRLRQLFDEES